ncbi:PQQ-binding-like beta-propeller repeat protein [Streptosporangium sp. NPDC049376]|uniref:outer membrane protein assembly factor BamB family protein n=1 Tax=Streptosporangium sp. NPDC049376 TaxID=3366192 RepID=UPI00379726BB
MRKAMRTRLLAVLLVLVLPLPLADAPAAAQPRARLVPLWHRDVSIPQGEYGYALTSRDFLVYTARGVLALGLDDGRPRWRHHLSTATAVGWSIASGVFVVDYYQPFAQVNRRHQLIAVSSVTGKELWRRRGLSLPPRGRRSAALQDRSPVFLTRKSEKGGLIAVSPGTARDLWSFRPPAGCDVSQSAVRAADVVLLLTCGRSPRMLLLDVATGATRRSVRLPAGAVSDFQVADHVIALFGDGAMTLYDDEGRAVLRRGECWPRCAMTYEQGLVLTTYHSGEEDVMEAASWPGGAPVWQVRPAPAYTGLVEGGVGIRATEEEGLPVVDLVEPGTGEVTSYGLPTPGRPLASAGERLYAGSVMSAVGQTPSVRIAALRRGQGGGTPLLAGVDPGRWPDACALSPGRTFSAGTPRTTLSGYTMPSPVACRHTDRNGGHLVVRVLWVADDPGEAVGTIETLRDVYAYRPVTGIGDQAVADATLPSTVVLRAGSVVVSVVSGDISVRRRLTELSGSVADRLRETDVVSEARAVPAPAPPQRFRLLRLPGTRTVVAEDATTSPWLGAYLSGEDLYVRVKGVFARFDGTVRALSPTGAWGAGTTESYPAQGRDPVTIVDTATGKVREVPTVKAPMGVVRPVWSPDGRLLLTARTQEAITGFVIVDVATMSSRFVHVAHGGRYSGGFRWGADFKTVAVQTGLERDEEDAHRDVTFFDLHGAVRHRFKKVGKLMGEQNWMSPSGRVFATRCAGQAGQLCLWRTADGAQAARVPVDSGRFIAWYGEDRFLGRHTLSSGERVVGITDLLGRLRAQLATTPKGEELEPVVVSQAGA